MTRAMCCRINDQVNDFLPEGYYLNHPFLGRVSVYLPTEDAGENAKKSLNWCEADLLEILDGPTGVVCTE